MNLRFRQVAALALIISWIFAQNILLQHEYSSEHWSQSDSHVCLSFINDDDLMVGLDVFSSSVQPNSFIHLPIVLQSGIKLHRYFNARAPPFSLA